MKTTQLRYVQLQGPELAPGRPFWTLCASAPHSFSTSSRHIAEDNIHPLRALLIDAAPADGAQGFRQPQLVGIHLIAGHGTGPFATIFEEESSEKDRKAHLRYRPEGFDRVPRPDPFENRYCYAFPAKEWLSINVVDSKGKSVAQQPLSPKRFWQYGKIEDFKPVLTAAYFHTGPVSDTYDTPSAPAPAIFQHVLAEPILGDAPAWPGDGGDDINVPPFRLVAGSVELAVADGAFQWLGEWQPRSSVASEPGRIRRYSFVLTPDGIEMQCKVHFPGATEQLEGPFLLAPANGRLSLTLLPDKLSARQRKAWLGAWAAVLPAAGREEAVHGFRVAGNPQDVPAFRYLLDVKPLESSSADEPGMKILTPLRGQPVLIPAQHLRLDILSPQALQGGEGVVNCAGGWFMLGTVSALEPYAVNYFGSDALYRQFAVNTPSEALVLAWASPLGEDEPQGVTPIYLRLQSPSGDRIGNADMVASLVTSENAPYLLAHDERRLAASLREAYGWPALPPGPLDLAHPIAGGFIPMSDGWLQLPFPNLPPVDLQSDSDMLRPPQVARRNALDGFLRFSHEGDLPQVQSGFDHTRPASALVNEAPWSVTIERADRLRVAVVLGAAANGGVTPAAATALMDDPDLSARGLLWLSSDRPDALEAIARLGAGAGAYFDVPMERRKDERLVMRAALSRLVIRSVPGAVRPVVTRDDLALTLDFDVATWRSDWMKDATPAAIEPYRWWRHPVMPLAAQMPMTRSASSSVRPLESRDLVPFQYRPVGTSPTRVAALEWSLKAVFPVMSAVWEYRLAQGWTVPPLNVTGPLAALQVRGIGLAAFGVPGAELAPAADTWSANPWAVLRAALRHDLPVLDEAFATATLPRVQDDSAVTHAMAPQELLQSESEAHSATALDWNELRRFWGEQERRLQLSRVAHSYITDFKPAGVESGGDVSSLVGTFSWKAARACFMPASGSDLLPYGSTMLGGVTRWSGNRALEGLDGTFTVHGDELVPGGVASATAVSILGNSPGSFMLGEYLTDARGAGTKPLSKQAGWWRPVSDRAAKKDSIVGRWSSDRTFDVYGAAVGSDARFRFWFKDIPLSAAGTFDRKDGIETGAWMDGVLQRCGLEWRLLPVKDRREGFDKGADRMPFGDFMLEPMRLQHLDVGFAAGAPTRDMPGSVAIHARLHLGADGEDVHDGGNLVRMQLDGHADRLFLQDVAPVTGALRFPIRVVGGLVTVRAEAMTWSGGRLSLRTPSLTFEFAGQEVVLQGARHNAEKAGGPTFEWSAGAEQRPGCLCIRSARLYIDASPGGSRLELDCEVVIATASDGRPAAASIVANVNWTSGEPTSACTLHILDSEIKAEFKQTRCALFVTVQDGTMHTRALIHGFPATGAVRFGLVTALGPFVDGSAKLGSGRFSGSVSAMPNGGTTRAKLALSRIVMAGKSAGMGAHWEGGLKLYGTLDGRSAIGWPQVSLPSSDDGLIPFPETDANGRRKVVVDASRLFTHDVQWVLDGHEVSFDTASRINLGDEQTGLWSATLMARHSLRRGEALVLQFWSVDTVAIGSMAAMIPSWPSGADASLHDRVARSTFASRYRSGSSGMTWPGRGGLGTVLQGIHGEAFRRAIHASGNAGDGKQVVVLGGFVGLIEVPGQKAVPLLRLPALMGLTPGYLGDGSDPILRQGGRAPAILEVAWPDSLAAEVVATTFRAGVSPATSSEADLEAAVRAGAKAVDLDPATSARFASALMVEQSFPVNLVQGALEETPYFLSSSAGLARILNARVVAADQVAPPRVLSLVARSALVGRDKKTLQRRAVALTLARGDDKEIVVEVPPPQGELTVVGDQLSVQPWQGLDFREQPGEVIGAQATMRAYRAQARPRAALASDVTGGFQRIDLPLPALPPRGRELLEQVFADSGRGYMLPVVEGEVMAGVEDGFLAAVRDTDGSGIAAVSRVSNLPAHASVVASNTTPIGDLVWLAWQRAPLYLPIASGLNGEAIPWLVPAAPRSRLPATGALMRALDNLKPLPTEQQNGAGIPHAVETPSEPWQPFLPEQVMTAAVSERPGILMARHMRLEVGADRGRTDGDAFDGQFSRFGAPAQASTSVARVDRTPRPAKLPQNDPGVDAVYHRRPSASPLLPLLNHHAWIGPADSLGGVYEYEEGDKKVSVEWTATFVAAPETSGMVMESWDGTLRLVVEVDEVRTAAPDSWKKELYGLLLSEPANASNVTASAALVIDGRALPFRSMHILSDENRSDMPKGMVRGRVTIMLDMRDPRSATARQPGAAHPAIGELLANPGRVPSVELKLTLRPDKNLAAQPDLSQPLALSLSADQVLPGGLDRAPVTLRFPLWPVLRGRGGLALEPTSLLFCDGSYDSGLSAPPYEEARRLQGATGVPEGRGGLRAVLAADRRRMNRQGTLTLMADVRFDVRLPPPHSFERDVSTIRLEGVVLSVQPRAGERRELLVGGVAPDGKTVRYKARLDLGSVHELPLAKLVETDGTPARIAVGDMLEIAVTFPATGMKVGDEGEQSANWSFVTLPQDVALTLRVVLTDEPVTEPPPGLYAALTRTKGTDGAYGLSLPLYAQSPLPWRVDLQNAAADFRAGLLRRRARFVWTLARPSSESKRRGVHIVKSDRNGQTYLPELTSEDDQLLKDFIVPQRMGSD